MFFLDARRNQIPGASVEEMAKLRLALGSEWGISDSQIVESVAFSMAMVVRSALGLHANDGSIGILYHDTLSGWIALATARHLGNAGSSISIVECAQTQNPSVHLKQQLYPLRRAGVTELTWEALLRTRGAEKFLSSCHNLVCGISGADNVSSILLDSLPEILNDHSIPVHCIGAPIGLNLESGVANVQTLYASSTTSLGIPYKGLATGQDWVGRHYLADISLPRDLIEQITGRSFPIIFSEQPVIQIFPPTDEEI